MKPSIKLQISMRLNLDWQTSLFCNHWEKNFNLFYFLNLLWISILHAASNMPFFNGKKKWQNKSRLVICSEKHPQLISNSRLWTVGLWTSGFNLNPYDQSPCLIPYTVPSMSSHASQHFSRHPKHRKQNPTVPWILSWFQCLMSSHSLNVYYTASFPTRDDWPCLLACSDI